MKYQYIRNCTCGHIEYIEVNKREAAFRLRDKEIFNLVCSKCGGTEFNALSHPQPEFDKGLLLEWGNNAEYYFMEQDEDLMLAEESNINIILDVLDNHKILEGKRNILIEALCVIIYDNSVSDNKNTQLIDRVAHELQKRKKDVLHAQDGIMEYIKVVAFPIIGISKN